jgi:hypothetical protein
MNAIHSLLAIATALLVAVPVWAQQLRHAVADATLIVIVEPIDTTEVGEHVLAHRFRVIERLKGECDDTIVVLEHEHIADAPSVRGEGRRLLCLTRDRRSALPTGVAVAWKGTGYAGSSPTIGDAPQQQQVLRLARILVASDSGTAPAATADALTELMLQGSGPAQREAVEALRERGPLREHLEDVDLDAALARAVAETRDIDLKIALASLCAETRPEGVVEALCSGLTACGDERYARAIGRIANHIHGEEAARVLGRFLVQARGAFQERLLLALGATRTDSALQMLLELRRTRGAAKAVDAALREHGAVRAIEAIEPRKKG